jgi:RNase P subunit RPR2
MHTCPAKCQGLHLFPKSVKPRRPRKVPACAAKDWGAPTCSILDTHSWCASRHNIPPAFLLSVAREYSYFYSFHAILERLRARALNMTSSEALRGLRTLSRHATPRRVPASVVADSRRTICLDCRMSMRAGRSARVSTVSARVSLGGVARTGPAAVRGYAQAAKECMFEVYGVANGVLTLL